MMSDYKVFILLFLLLLSGVCTAQDNLQLQKLLSPLAETKHIKLEYEEKRSSLFFKQPQLYQGYIEYISPDTFIKQVAAPNKKKMQIIGDQLTLYHYSKDSSELVQKQVISLDDYPQFKQLKALFMGLFQANISELTRYYHYTINSLADKKTQLRLKSINSNPFTQNKQQNTPFSQQVDIIFNHGDITKITMRGLGGEISELIFDKKVFKQNVLKQNVLKKE